MVDTVESGPKGRSDDALRHHRLVRRRSTTATLNYYYPLLFTTVDASYHTESTTTRGITNDATETEETSTNLGHRHHLRRLRTPRSRCSLLGMATIKTKAFADELRNLLRRRSRGEEEDDRSRKLPASASDERLLLRFPICNVQSVHIP